MREIKFRAWDDKNKKWLTDKDAVYLSDDGLAFILVVGATSDYLSRVYVEIQQYTGLKDKNGKEIYEGDIIKWGHLKGSKEFEIRIAEVKIDPDIQFDCNNIKYPYIFHYGKFMYSSNQLEVIGNIHENHELLNQSNTTKTDI